MLRKKRISINTYDRIEYISLKRKNALIEKKPRHCFHGVQTEKKIVEKFLIDSN